MNVIVRLLGDSILRGILQSTNAKLYTCQLATDLAWNYTDPLVQELHTNFWLRGVSLSYPRTYVSLQHNNSVNNSLPSAIHTGAGDINRIGQYKEWQGNVDKIKVWPSGTGANDINGTEGFFFHPFLRQGEQVEIFVDDTYRSFQLVQTDIINARGIEAYRFSFVNSLFESAFTNPKNVRWGSWNPDGLFYLGYTQDPIVPVFGSKPHFLDGDPELLEKVNGLDPDHSKHESYLNVEPLTGANVQFQIQLQINVQVNQTSTFQ